MTAARLRLSAALVLLLALLAFPAAAAASSATTAEIRALAAKAVAGDKGALADLRAVREVDGQPRNLADELDASGRELDARLSELAKSAPNEQQAKRQGGTGLRRTNNAPHKGPSPRAGAARFLRGKYDALARVTPGGHVVLTIGFALLLVVPAFILARRNDHKRRRKRAAEAAAEAAQAARLAYEAEQDAAQEPESEEAERRKAAKVARKRARKAARAGGSEPE